MFAEDEDEQADCKKPVALKLMSDPIAVQLEVSQLRRSKHENNQHLVRALRFHLTHDDASLNDSGYTSCVVFPRGDRTLSDAIIHGMFAGRIHDVSALAMIRDVMLQLSAGLLHLHESCGAVHCDFKPMNAMQFGQTWKLIDFDCTVLIGRPAGRKGSTLVAPPELGVLDGTQPVLRNPESDRRLLADPSYDVWSFGVVLYNLITGHPLFLTNCDDNLDAHGMWALLTWGLGHCKQLVDQHLSERSSILAIRATELLYWMLQPIAADRPSMRDIRMHSLFQDDMHRSALPCSKLPFECFHSRQNLVPATVYLTSPPAYDTRDVFNQLRSFCPLFAKHVHVNIAPSDALELGKSGTAAAPVPWGTTASGSSMLQRGIKPTAPNVKSKKVKSTSPNNVNSNEEFDYSTRWAPVSLSYPIAHWFRCSDQLDALQDLLPAALQW